MITNPTQIQLSNGSVLTTKDGTAFPITFAISDVRDISKKTGTFSKSITIPGTKANNKILNNYYDVNIQAGTFDINKIVDCAVIQNGVTILDNMTIQLISVNKTQNNNNYEQEVSYTVLIKDKLSDFFTKLNNKELTDLTTLSGLSVGNLTAQNIINSFDNTYIDGFKFTIPYGVQTGGKTTMKITECMPAIYAKNYFDGIFASAGFSYKWDEQYDELVGFDKLIIPWNGAAPLTSQVTVNEYLVNAKSTSALTITNMYNGSSASNYKAYNTAIIDGSPKQVLLPNEIVDGQNLWNNTTSIYTSPDIPTHTKITVEVTITYSLSISNGGCCSGYLKGFEKIYNGNQVPTKANLVIGPSFFINQDGKKTTPVKIVEFEIPNNTFIPASGLNLTTEYSSTTISFVLDGIKPNQKIDLNYLLTHRNSLGKPTAWHNIFYNLTDGAGATPYQVPRINFNILSSDIKIYSLKETEYGYNVPLNLQSFIPQKIKQSDFVKSIFTMYNLFAEVDKTNPRQLNLKSRDKYYDDGEIKDWTQKLNKEKSQDLVFLPELQSKKITLTYKKDDNDDVNKQYTSNYNEVYGEVSYVFDNEFIKGEQKQEIIFSPSPMFTNEVGAIVPLYDGFNPNTNIRILYDGGVYSANTQYLLIEDRDQLTSTSGTSTASTITYPFINHWNKPVDPTFDINFAQCHKYYRTDNYGTVTNNNLFNLFWRRTMNQINTGKLLSAYFNLTESDIQSLKLSDKIRIDNSWWNINKVIDYDANSTNPTKVELISIDNNLEIPFKTKDITLSDKTTPEVIEVLNKYVKKVTPRYNDFFGVGNWEVIGNFNTVSTDFGKGIIIGDDNNVTRDSFIFGNGNNSSSDSTFIVGDLNDVSIEGLRNIAIFGDNITATTSNTLYTNNILMTSGSTINGVPIESIIATNNEFTGGTVTGATIFTNGLSANTISATTYENLPFLEKGLGEGNSFVQKGVSASSTGKDSIAFGPFANANALEPVETGVTAVSACTTIVTDPAFSQPAIAFTGDVSSEWNSYVYTYNSDVFIYDAGSANTQTLNYTTITGIYYDSFTDLTYIVDFSIDLLYAYETAICNSYKVISLPAFSIAIGEYTQSSGKNSVAVGGGTLANAQAAFAEGLSTQANGIASHAEGFESQANGDYSTARGYQTNANGFYSFASGYRSTASGSNSFVHGQNSLVSGLRSIVLGNNITGTSADTTYVDKLNVKRLISGSSVTNIGIDSSGNLISGATITSSIFNNASNLPASNLNEDINRNGKITLQGTQVNFGTTTNLSSPLLGSGFGHIAGGGGTTGFQTFFGNGHNSGLPNAIIGSTSGQSEAIPALTFVAVKDTSYAKYTGASQTLFRFTNGYVASDFLIDVKANDIRLYKYPGTRNDTGTTTNYLSTDSSGNLISKPTTSLDIPYWISGTGTNSIVSKMPNNKPQAQGQRALAGGWNTQASGFTSFAWGDTVYAFADSSVAFGQGSAANADMSTAFGFATSTNGVASLAHGYGSIAWGDYSIALGRNTNSYGLQSLASGDNSTANGDNSVAFGYNSTADGINSFVQGSGSTAVGTNTVVLGANISGTSDNTTYVDKFNIKNATTISSGFTGTTLLIRETTGEIKQITINDLLNLIGVSEYELIIKMEAYGSGGTPTLTVLKDDLNIGSGVTATNFTSNPSIPNNNYQWSFSLNFSGTGKNVDKFILKYAETPTMFSSLNDIDSASNSDYDWYPSNVSNLKTYYSKAISDVNGYGSSDYWKFIFVYRVLP